MEKEENSDYFVIARLHREDFEARGFDASQVSDAVMQRIATKMGDNFVEQQFWIDIDFWGDELGLKEIKVTNET